MRSRFRLSPVLLVALLLALPPAIAQQLLDVNTATPAQLRALPGMGDEYVRRIVANRPYTAKNQLATRGVLPEPAYRQIEGLIIAHRLKPPPAK